MSFKSTPTLRSRRRFYFTDGPGTMRPDPEDCDCEAGDAGRIRFAKAPESNHYGGGEFRDVHNPDPQSERSEALWTDPRTASGGSGPAYSGSRPPKNATNVGALGQPVIEARQDGKVGLAGTTAYDPRTNLSTVGRDPDVMYSTSARGGVGALRPDGMGSRATEDAKRIRAINRKNALFWRNAGKPDPEDELDEENADNPPTPQPDTAEPAITRHERTNPDGSRVVVQHELHPAPAPTTDTNTAYRGISAARGEAGIATIRRIAEAQRKLWERK